MLVFLFNKNVLFAFFFLLSACGLKKQPVSEVLDPRPQIPFKENALDSLEDKNSEANEEHNEN